MLRDTTLRPVIERESRVVRMESRVSFSWPSRGDAPGLSQAIKSEINLSLP